NQLVDVFYNAETNETLELPTPRIDSVNTHGTGCTLSSAIASFLAHGLTLTESVIRAKEYINQAIANGVSYQIGQGHGPVHHFYKYWE
ncbi:MAG: bifunctional hydroxymethylpyrimidine kinase/phosphomethylpyrimidine kinase, partial [Bacteroides graminisolvens]|uniref:bifunctional hydroxymethylpyrimidine kinase/phosphomethylpyrimidine kinase n=1 Tax=Bacteroides graminisolvens TaxID=477666 RepID=UPI003A8A6960